MKWFIFSLAGMGLLRQLYSFFCLSMDREDVVTSWYQRHFPTPPIDGTRGMDGYTP